MATKEQRRQKKLAKKRTKEVAQRKEMARQRNSMRSTAGQISAAASGAIGKCMVSEGLFEDGIRLGIVLISRRLPDGRVACVWFLVDALCLGVKDLHALVGNGADINGYIDELGERQPLRIVAPAYARKLVESAVAYAAQFDLHPAAGYKNLAPIWGDIDPSDCADEFQFGGENGKPRFVDGPYDSAHFRAQVIEKLEQHAGQGNFDIVFMGSSRSDSVIDLIPMVASGDDVAADASGIAGMALSDVRQHRDMSRGTS